MNTWINLSRILLIMIVVISVNALDLNHLAWATNSKAYLGLMLSIILGFAYQILLRKKREASIEG